MGHHRLVQGPRGARLGNAALPAPDLLAIFQFWNLAAGTDQPAGEWVGIAREVAEARRVPFADEARLLALVSMALADVVAPTFCADWTNAADERAATGLYCDASEAWTRPSIVEIQTGCSASMSLYCLQQ